MIRRILKRLRSPPAPSRPRVSRPSERSPPPRLAPEPAPGIPPPDQARSLVFYSDQACGFCQRVLRALDRLGLEVELLDVGKDSSARSAHRKRTGRYTVPCLYIDDIPLFESADIVRWLEAYAEVDRSQGA